MSTEQKFILDLNVDYSKVDEKVRRTIENMESKPHIRYIRYLLTKRYSPISIKKELQRLGLSAPHEAPLKTYFLSVMFPIIKKYDMAWLYADYKNRLLSRKNAPGAFAKHILNYRLHLGDNLDAQPKFCKLVSALGIGELWMKEIYKFHGCASELPVDKNGERILKTTTTYAKSIDNILLCDKRYLIDKFILENVPTTRISKYCRDNLKLRVQDYDIEIYKRVFFNMKTKSIEEKIKLLELEKQSLQTVLEDIKNGARGYDDLELSDKNTITKQTTQRLEELNDNIRMLNSMFSEAAMRVAECDQQDFEKMFADVVARAYSRFTNLDAYKDRDVVDPLFKTARMMSFAYDKVDTIRMSKKGASTNSDRNSQGVVLELCKQRIEDINAEHKRRVAEKTGDDEYGNIIADDVAGIEELGVAYDVDEESLDKVENDYTGDNYDIEGNEYNNSYENSDYDNDDYYSDDIY